MTTVGPTHPVTFLRANRPLTTGGDKHVTKHQRPLTAALTLVCLAATGCTTSTTTTADPKPSNTPQPTTQSPRAESEEAQGNRAKAALEPPSRTDEDPDFVESGLERAQDGVHSLSPVKKGKTYRISVACVGTGTVKVTLADKPRQPVACNGVPATHHIENAPAHLPIDITATSGATGMVAWRVASVPS